MAVYYILMKPVLKIYPPVTVTAWSYCFGALVMAAVSLMYVHPAFFLRALRNLRKFPARAPAQNPSQGADVARYVPWSSGYAARLDPFKLCADPSHPAGCATIGDAWTVRAQTFTCRC